VLGRNESWQGPVSCTLNGPAGRQKLDFMLFRENNLSVPYRQEQLWINYSENRSSVPIKQNTRVVVLATGDDSGGGSVSRRTSQKLASQTNQSPKIDKKSEPEENDIKHVTASEPKTDAGQISSKDDTSGKQQEVLAHEADLDLPEQKKAGGNLGISDKDNKSSENEKRRSDSTIFFSSISMAPSEDKKADSTPEDGKDTDASKNGASKSPSADKEEPSQPSDSSTPGAAAGAKDSGAGQKSDQSKTSGIEKEIDSWVSTRSMGSGSSDKSHDAYASKNIRYVKGDKGGRAVLGRSGTNSVQTSGVQSKTPVKLG